MKKDSLTVFCACFFCCSAAFAQELKSVTFEQPDSSRFADDVFRMNVQSRKGAVYDERVVNDDIKRLHSTGFFSDVVAETQKNPDGTIDLVFRIAPKAVIKEVKIIGNEKYDTDKLREQITVTAGGMLNDKRLIDSANALRKFYADRGHNDAKVDPRFITEKDGSVTVEFRIKENLKQKIERVVFTGATAFPESELKSSIMNQHSWLHWIPFLDLGLLNKRELENDAVRLRELYWTKGYLDFNIKETRLHVNEQKPDFVTVEFIVDEGEPYNIGNVSITGNQRLKTEELTPLLTLKKGDVFSSAAERATVQAIDDRYSPMGYADLLCRVNRIPDYLNHTVDLVVDINEGKPYKVREIFISGNKWTKDHVIRRELAIQPDDPVDKHLIDASRSRLLGMGYFNKVDAVSISSPEADKKDIDIKVEEKNYLNAKIGAGWSDTDSLAGMLELTHSNLDILDPRNYFMGGGQRARLLAMYGIERYNFEADFTEPWLFGIQLRWDVSGYLRNVEYEHWDEQRIGVTTSLTKRIFDDFTTISGGYTFEHVRVHHMSKHMSEVFQKEKGGSYVGRIHLTLDRDTRDNAMDPTSGYMVNLLTSVSTELLGGSENYYRLELKGINYYSFFDKMFVWSLGAKIGMIGSIGDWKKDPPIYERYFLGSGDTVRGFPYRSIGPVDKNKDNYGGDFMYLLTTEITHPIWNFIRGAVFVDVGDATHSRFGPFNSPNIGVGYGLRIKLPVVNAPIKLDLAYPLLNNQKGVSNSIRFHFNMGFSMF